MKTIYFVIVTLLCAALMLAGCAAPAASSPEAAEATRTTESAAEAAATEDVAVEQSEEPAVSTEAAGAAVIEPEQLISQAEAEAILGKPVTAEHKEQEVVGLKLCFYDGGDDTYLQIGITQQAFMPADNPNTPQGLYDGTHAAFPDGESVNFGDEGFLATTGYNIMQSGYYITVTAGLNDDAATLAKMDEAAALAIENLKALLAS